MAVVAAHGVLFFLVRSETRYPEEVVDISLWSLPITPEDESEEVKPLPQPAPSVVTREKPRDAPVREPETAPITELQTIPETQSKPAVDWFAEARTSADILDKRATVERERRSFSGPNGKPMRPERTEPVCPFEKCEPGYGKSSIFTAVDTKKGRIEKTAQGEVIRWISNSCYQILITPNPMHMAMTMCVVPLDKKGPRGDLFDHMHDVPPQTEKATDLP